ncbi:phage tail protein [Adonisia turfae]|uniref:Phage tail protein n=1 Tax=Adonisia turfae CCMR0081 TaxID=2292702 RepID=A0A6M0RPY2_9CYAN|nr:phage tail protein [Adonisia turfae]NEZ58219.1 hypothetical protein [Adonisia turfae CCMR0081]
MPYPDIPYIGRPGDRSSFAMRPIEIEAAENAMVSRGRRNQLQRSRSRWAVAGNVRNGLELHQFLQERRMRPFGFSPDGTPDKRRLYFCRDWRLRFLGAGSGVAFHEFSATFEETFVSE